MGKHTEGPWTQIREGHDIRIESEHLELCLVYGDEENAADADARLISKSPEMLDLLEDCAAVLHLSNWDKDKVLANKIDAIITEIEGQ